jgi:hypothetical protein
LLRTEKFLKEIMNGHVKVLSYESWVANSVEIMNVPCSGAINNTALLFLRNPKDVPNKLCPG